jgi:exopolyphosphatase/pppGpp-phosphohydrolase
MHSGSPFIENSTFGVELFILVPRPAASSIPIMVKGNLGSIVSVVDIGSNSIKFLKANVQRKVPQPGTFSTADSGSYVTRLSENTASSRAFSKTALARTEAALRTIFEKTLDSDTLYILATESARKVDDPEPLVRLVKEIFGKPLEILSGQEEAKLSALGATAAAKNMMSVSQSGNQFFQFIEIGGGSSQIGLTQGHTVEAISIPWGAVTVFEKFPELQSPHHSEAWDRVAPRLAFELTQKNTMGSLNELKATMNKHRDSVIARLGIGGTLINTAKGFLTLESKSHKNLRDTEWGIQWPLDLFKTKCVHFSSLTVKERLKIQGIDEGRADIMPAGLFLFFFLAEFFEMSGEFLFTHWGLRYGKIQEIMNS